MARDDAALEAEIGITLGKLQRQLSSAEARMNKTASKMEKRFANTNRAVVRSFGSANRGASMFANGGMRQVSMQLSQVAQMGSVTGDWVRALSIQLPDLALGFGAVGIVAGALAGVLAPMAFDMLGVADASKELKKTLDALEASVKRLQSAQSRLTSGKLTEEYGSMTDEAIKLLEVERQIANLRAQQKIQTAQRGIAEGFGLGGAFALNPQDVADYVEAVHALRAERDALDSSVGQMSDTEFVAANRRVAEIKEQLKTLRNVSDGMTDLQEMLGITEDEARQVAIQFAEIGKADGPQQQAEAMISLVNYISKVSGNLSDASDEGKSLYDQLLQAAFAMLDIAAIDIATNIGAGADEAERLAKNLALAKQGQILLDAARNNPDFYDPRGEAGTSGSRDPNAYNVPLGLPPVNMPPNPRSKSRGGGGAKQDSELNRLLRERDRILRDLETASDKYARQVEDLNKLHEMGELSTEQYNAAMKKLDEQLVNAEFGNVVKGIDDVSRALADAIVQGEDFGDALANIGRRLLSEGIASNLRLLLGGGIGKGGFLGSLFGAILPGNATGTDFWRGGLTRVNEQGGEIMNLPRGTQIIPHDISKRMAAQPAQAAPAKVVVEGGNLTLSDDGRIMSQVNVRVQQGAAQTVQTVRKSLDGWQQQLGTEGALV